MLAYSSDLFGVASHPEFSEKLIKELQAIRPTVFGTGVQIKGADGKWHGVEENAGVRNTNYYRTYMAHIAGVNQLLTDEYNTVYMDAVNRYMWSVSHKEVWLKRYEVVHPLLKENNSAHNDFLVCINLSFSREVEVAIQCVPPLRPHKWTGCSIDYDGVLAVKGQTAYMIYLKRMDYRHPDPEGVEG